MSKVAVQFASVLGISSFLILFGARPCVAQGSYHLVNQFPIGGSGGWDYISVDGGQKRLYVSHSKQVEVLDENSGKSVGVIPDTAGVHGIAIAPELKRGFTSNGGDGSVTIFDTETLKTIKKVKANDPSSTILSRNASFP